MRFIGRTLLGVTLIALTAGLLALGAGVLAGALEERAGREERGRPPSERVFAARVTEVVPGEVVPVLTAFGELRAGALPGAAGACLGADRVARPPRWSRAGRWRRGDVLLRIDPAEAEAALSRARADAASAEADIRDALRTLDLARDELAAAEEQSLLRERAAERARDLAGRGIGTEAATEEAELVLSSARQAVLVRRQSLASAEARLDQARVAADRVAIDLAEAERERGDLDVTAAFDGVLAQVSANAGRAGDGQRAARGADRPPRPWRWRSGCRRRSTRGCRGRARAWRSRSTWLGSTCRRRAASCARARRSRTGAPGGSSSRRWNGAAGLRPGDFVTVRVTEPALTGVALLPAGAVGPDGTVLALGEEDRLEPLPAEVLRRQGDDVIVAAAGLAGREVVTERSPLLGAGIRVEPLRDGPDGSPVAPEEPDTVQLDEDRRARLIAFVEEGRMPAEAKARVLAQLREPEVPSATVARIEGRMGG